VLTDITELTRTIQIKTDFVANASHELRTPLSAIRAGVETILSMNLSHDGESATQIFGVIDRQSARLGAIVADLLELSRVEAPNATFEADAVRLTELIAEVRERSSEALAEKRHEWSVNIDPAADELVVSRHLLRLVLDNLVENAIKFTDAGGRIEVRAERRGDDVAITVSDNGCGIPADEQERVFERFYQVERARTGSPSRGTGLGLSIVRHAVNAMHGTVELHSAVGTGTRIVVTVPQQGALFRPQAATGVRAP
jgi:two-component system phosphate regulon sensor histidine kinase PhoR